MTTPLIPCAPGRAACAHRPLADRILAVYALDPASRRICALLLCHELLRAPAPITTTGVLAWADLAALLDHCATELRLADDTRDVYFRGLATSAYRISRSVRDAVHAHRPAAGITATVRAPRSWSPSRVIDLDTLRSVS